MKRTLTTLVVLAASGLAACGNDAAGGTAGPADASGVTEASPGATEPARTTEPAVGAGSAAESEFPVTIEHKYGATTIDAEPQRVVSIGFAEHDGLLALGVIPVAVRDWYGEQPDATWPWAQDELGDATPEVLPSTALNFEQIAALQPDLILGIGSGMTDEEYAILSAIAPTVAQPGEYIEYGTPWDVSLQITGRAVGRADVAAQVIADTEQLFATARAAHPEFAGATAAVTYYFEEQPGTYGSQDSRSRVLRDLGFVVPPAIDEAAGDAFFVSVSAEDLSLIDTDVVIWIGLDASGTEQIRTLPTRSSMRAFREGRELVADDLLSGAFSHANALSLGYVIEQLVPELALAVDGDPTTAVPSAANIAPDFAAANSSADGDEAAAAAAAWSLVGDPDVTFTDEPAHIDAAAALEATIGASADAGTAMGGISPVPAEVRPG